MMLPAYIFAIGLLPGLCVWILLGMKRHVIIWSHLYSLTLFCVVLLLGNTLNLEWSSIWAIMLSVGLLLLCFVAVKVWRRSYRESIFNGRSIYSEDTAAVILILLSAVAYVWVVGVYDSVPSDILRHLERIQFARSDLLIDYSFEPMVKQGFSGNYLYYYYAALMVFSGSSIQQLFFWLTIFNSSFLLLGIYSFAKYQFQDKGRGALAIGLISCLLFVLHQGIVGFSHIRYYSLSATMICIPAFLLSIISVDRWYAEGISNRRQFIRNCVSLVIVLILCWLIHPQELIFIASMGVLVAGYYSIANIAYGSTGGVLNLPALTSPRPLSTKATNIAFAMVAIIALTAVLVLIGVLDRTPADQNKVVSLSVWFSDLPQHWYVLNPFHQFSRVATLWGVVVYMLAVLHWRYIYNRPLLLCGLLIPFFTVFNPVFVDLFLRIRDAHVLYRMLYAVPLSLAAAYFIYLGYQRIRSREFIAMLSSVAVFAMLVITLFPINTGLTLSSYSRLRDLLPVSDNNSLRHWQDLTDFLESDFDHEVIISDPVTGYIVTATTDNISPRFKFTNRDHAVVNFDDYSVDPFKIHTGNLLVINLRDGGLSRAGAESGHWPEDVLKVQQYYSDELLAYIDSKPERLNMLWQKNRVSVYRIQ